MSELSLEERDRRYRNIREMMVAQKIDVLLAAGTGDFSHEGHARYLFGPDYWIATSEAYVVLSLEGEPSLLVTSKPIGEMYSRNSWIKETQGTMRNPLILVESIRKKISDHGTLGVTMDAMPAFELDAIRSHLPKVKIVDAADIMWKARIVKSEEEICLLGKSAKLADESFLSAVEATRIGSTHCEIVAAADQAAKRKGAEKLFNLIVAGQSPVLTWWPIPSNRIKNGDMVVLELTPRYYGYWTQLVRCYGAGKISNEMRDIYTLCVEAEKRGMEQARSGNKVSDIAFAANRVIREAGFKPPMRSGHAMGLDISEFSIVESNKTILEPGMVMVIHPSIILKERDGPDQFGQGGFFGPGDTYVITDSSPQRLTNASRELLIC